MSRLAVLGRAEGYVIFALTIVVTATTLLVVGRLTQPLYVELVKHTFTALAAGGGVAAFRDVLRPKS